MFMHTISEAIAARNFGSEGATEMPPSSSALGSSILDFAEPFTQQTQWQPQQKFRRGTFSQKQRRAARPAICNFQTVAAEEHLSLSSLVTAKGRARGWLKAQGWQHVVTREQRQASPPWEVPGLSCSTWNHVSCLTEIHTFGGLQWGERKATPPGSGLGQWYLEHTWGHDEKKAGLPSLLPVPTCSLIRTNLKEIESETRSGIDGKVQCNHRGWQEDCYGNTAELPEDGMKDRCTLISLEVLSTAAIQQKDPLLICLWRLPKQVRILPVLMHAYFLARKMMLCFMEQTILSVITWHIS